MLAFQANFLVDSLKYWLGGGTMGGIIQVYFEPLKIILGVTNQKVLRDFKVETAQGDEP